MAVYNVFSLVGFASLQRISLAYTQVRGKLQSPFSSALVFASLESAVEAVASFLRLKPGIAVILSEIILGTPNEVWILGKRLIKLLQDSKP